MQTIKQKKVLGSLVAAIVLAAGISTTAHAQIGNNWVAYTPSSTVQTVGHGYYDGDNTFRVIHTDGEVETRCERRYYNDYTTGSHQFQGNIIAYSGDGTCMKQTFKFFMLVAYPQNGGEFHQHSSTFLMSGVFGNTVRVNTLHYTSTGSHEVWLNGSKKYTQTQAPYTGSGWYDKIGCYNVSSGTSKCHWSGIQFWKK